MDINKKCKNWIYSDCSENGNLHGVPVILGARGGACRALNMFGVRDGSCAINKNGLCEMKDYFDEHEERIIAESIEQMKKGLDAISICTCF